ncbi:hypothetical protein LX32DRAFT_639215 [Colletotrichum zoysiae]|uniref:GPI anchored serine-threonine rich protein n=1 Tax=Colletotrichum zoysiae TaxID=1216348 RepID=A0AAD9HJC9_9PEZI|nr:hypothetical protein LX32DRAFT_639215 [Colletotrichum zoysiae]
MMSCRGWLLLLLPPIPNPPIQRPLLTRLPPLQVNACATADYDCLCAAKQAVATCYNNCPKDSRAAPAQGEVTIYCQQASLYGSAALRSKTEAAAAATATGSGVASVSASATPTSTAADDAASTSSSSATASSTPNMGVGQLARNTGGVLLAVAGVVAAVL